MSSLRPHRHRFGVAVPAPFFAAAFSRPRRAWIVAQSVCLALVEAMSSCSSLQPAQRRLASISVTLGQYPHTRAPASLAVVVLVVPVLHLSTLAHRWWNHLNPAVKKGAFSEWEDAVIIKVGVTRRAAGQCVGKRMHSAVAAAAACHNSNSNATLASVPHPSPPPPSPHSPKLYIHAPNTTPHTPDRLTR